MKNIKKIIQKKFKFIFYKIFALFHGKIKGKINSDNDSRIKVETVKKDNNLKYKIFKITNGSLYTDRIHDAAIIVDNFIVEGPSFQLRRENNVKGNENNAQVEKNIVFQKGTPRIKKFLNGKVLSLLTGGAGNDNYFHWLFDILPKIKICSEVYNLEDIENFYFSKLHEWQKNILEILDLKNIKILDSSIYRHVQASKIIAVEHPWYEKGYIQEEAGNVPDWIVNWLKETFLTKAEIFDANDKVLIDRRDDTKFNHCQIINDEEVFQYLKSKGFSKYKVGQLSFKKQIHLFSNAKVI